MGTLNPSLISGDVDIALNDAAILKSQYKKSALTPELLLLAILRGNDTSASHILNILKHSWHVDLDHLYRQTQNAAEIQKDQSGDLDFITRDHRFVPLSRQTIILIDDALSMANTQREVSVDTDHVLAMLAESTFTTSNLLRQNGVTFELINHLSVEIRTGKLKTDLQTKSTDTENMIRDLDHAIQLIPDDASLYAKRSLCHAMKFHIDEAISDAEKAVALDPQYWLAYYARGRAYQIDDARYKALPTITESGQKAIQALTQVIRMNSKFGDAYGYRAQVYIHQGNLDEAFADLKRALKYDPINWLMSMQLVVNSMANDGYNAIQMFTPALMPEYDEIMKGAIVDWDHYLNWRLKRRNQENR